MKKTRNDEGFIVKIVLVIIALITLKYYFHFDVIEWLKSDKVQTFISPAITAVKNFYSYMDNLVKGWTN
ncbi:MAG: hypothetical protein AB201_01515 [Parcubacteria bacterium C7867-006]|nr:MAG: hypothetical protein AB201_01515 [Parcubacteria bacterium C7867-006]